MKIRMISGEEEAEYDYLALKSVVDVPSGIGCDLGGGSLQVFTFDENGPKKSASYPLGSSRTAKNFVKGEIPTMEEISAIKNCVAESMGATGIEPASGALFAMGGTAKAIKTLYNATIEKGDTLSLKNVNIMLKLLTEAPAEAKELISAFAPKRIRTLVPGLAVLAGVMEKAGCDGMKIYSVGVREGFMESILNDDSKPEPSLLDFILGSI
jgi:exopolyphosphatase/guanosine-5'-triphosphate,3'-diphosphate pyrophosphatase